MMNMEEVIEFWKADAFMSNLKVPTDVSVRTAIALGDRGLAFYHRSTWEEDGYISVSPKFEDEYLNGE
jgi:hypothetical protein